MPQFYLNKPETGAHPYYALSDFAKDYVEAMFFTNGDTGDEREDLLNEWGVERLTKASVAAIKRDCDLFLASARVDLDQAYAETDYSAEQAGRDFWFTRQRHGVGFWDRDQLDWFAASDNRRKLQDTLSDVAHGMGESTVEAYRGWIYVR